MVDLIARPSGADVFPLEVGGLRAVEEDLGHVTALQPYVGSQSALAEALRAAHGMAWPAPNRATGKAGARAVWFGRDTVMLMGPAPDAALRQHAAVVTHSDAWCAVRLEGAGARDVLARLTPIDLRDTEFKRGHTARTELAHMAGSVTRVGRDTYLLLVFRSFARTFAHDLRDAMRGVAARERP